MKYVGAAQKLTEAQLVLQPIQMGARVYLPGLGRFLQVDPVQGGTPNPYTYVTDPVNDFDLSGTCGWKFWRGSCKTVKPGPIKGYSNWLFGGGKSQKVGKNDVKWNLSTSTQRGGGVYGLGGLGTGKRINALVTARADGAAHAQIGRVLGTFHGSITIDAQGKHVASGTFTPPAVASYHFNNSPGRQSMESFSTTAGRRFGITLNRLTGGLISPTDYNIYFEQAGVSVDVSW